MITITNRDCRGYLDDLRSPNAHDGIVCTEREDTTKRISICYNSFGSGLVSEQEGKVFGLFSWSDACYLDDDPHGFTRVSPYLDWFFNVTGIDYKIGM